MPLNWYNDPPLAPTNSGPSQATFSGVNDTNTVVDYTWPPTEHVPPPKAKPAPKKKEELWDIIRPWSLGGNGTAVITDGLRGILTLVGDVELEAVVDGEPTEDLEGYLDLLVRDGTDVVLPWVKYEGPEIKFTLKEQMAF